MKVRILHLMILLRKVSTIHEFTKSVLIPHHYWAIPSLLKNFIYNHHCTTFFHYHDYHRLCYYFNLFLQPIISLQYYYYLKLYYFFDFLIAELLPNNHKNDEIVVLRIHFIAQFLLIIEIIII